MIQNTTKLHTTGQTTKLQKVYDSLSAWRVLLAVLVVTMFLVGLVATVGHWSGGNTPSPQLQPVLIVSTPTPVSTPVVPTARPRPTTTTESRLSAAVVAYDAPGGTVLGPIDADRAYTITARYGTDWLQADIDGSGLVWIRSQELGTVTVAGALPDLRPAPTAEVVYVIQDLSPPSELVHDTPIAPSGSDIQPTAPLSTGEGPIREKPTPVLTEAEQYWTWPTAVPLARTPGVEVSSNAYEACRRSGQAFSECKQHMPDDYFTLHDQYDQ